jgi:hypothetical protein
LLVPAETDHNIISNKEFRPKCETLKPSGRASVPPFDTGVSSAFSYQFMARTFAILAVLLIVAMMATIGVGFYSFSLEKTDPAKKDVFLIHFYLGLITAIGILLLHCIIFTYFLGTGRWAKEVGLAYDLPDVPFLKETRELKRTTFPAALFAMLIAIATTAAGAGAQLQEWPWHVHATLAFLTLLFNVWAFRIEYRNLSRNVQVLHGVLDEVDRLRAERGLPSSAEAIEEELRIANRKAGG